MARRELEKPAFFGSKNSGRHSYMSNKDSEPKARPKYGRSYMIVDSFWFLKALWL